MSRANNLKSLTFVFTTTNNHQFSTAATGSVFKLVDHQQIKDMSMNVS